MTTKKEFDSFCEATNDKVDDFKARLELEMRKRLQQLSDQKNMQEKYSNTISGFQIDLEKIKARVVNLSESLTNSFELHKISSLIHAQDEKDRKNISLMGQVSGTINDEIKSFVGAKNVVTIQKNCANCSG